MAANQDDLTLAARASHFGDHIARRRRLGRLHLNVEVHRDRTALKQARQLVGIRRRQRSGRQGTERALAHHAACMRHPVLLRTDGADEARNRADGCCRLCTSPALGNGCAIA